MNRHERRAARAKRAPISESYEQTGQAMLAALKGWLAAHKGVPRFVFPPKDVSLAGTLAQYGHRLARDYNARELVDLFCQVGIDVGGAVPTVLMLQAVLELAGVPVEHVSLEELGLSLRSMGDA